MKVGDQVEARTYDGRFYQGVVTAITNTTSGNMVTVKVEPDKVLNVKESQCSFEPEPPALGTKQL